jgi:Protein of unknown function (DUF3551)
MRQIIGAAAFAAMAFAAAPASAQDYPYCIQFGEYGYPGLCYFATYQQCLARASGAGGYCGINPVFAFARQAQRQRFYEDW